MGCFGLAHRWRRHPAPSRRRSPHLGIDARKAACHGDGTRSASDLRLQPVGQGIIAACVENHNLDPVNALKRGVDVFHAGTERDSQGVLRSAAGRVLAITGCAPTLKAARDRAYQAVGKISLPGATLRNDIAADVVSFPRESVR